MPPRQKPTKPQKKTATLSAQLTQAQYHALVEHAWARRQRVGPLVRETLEAAGLFSLPEGEVAR